MSSAISKRKRARKACIPCHQRKRKCDTKYPCGMCTTYDYECKYSNDSTTGVAGDSVQVPPTATRTSLDGKRRLTSQSHVEQGPHKVNGLSTESPTVIASEPAGIFDEHKSRYTGASAAMAFPHILGVALGSDSPPKMRSFAYNFGIRPEEASNTYRLLGKLITEEELGFFSATYFSAFAPIGDVLDPQIYAQRCHDYYHGCSSSEVAFAAVAAGVASLGSFLSPNRHPRESDLVQYAKSILDDPASIRMLSIDHIVAWVMRVVYLRATTRPNNAWIASCTLMHLCETVGLHEEGNIQNMASMARAVLLGYDADRLRRIFWVSWAAHNMLSYEQDRSAVHFRAVTCQTTSATPESIADQFIRLIQIIPAPNSPFHLEWQPLNRSEELFARLKALEQVHVTHPFLVVTKADIALCFFRRIYQLKTSIPDDFIQLVIDSGNAGVEAAEQLANQGRLFWNAIGSVFQYACVLLAIDTPAASNHIVTAFKGLENLVKAADTGLTREALSIARHLLSLSISKKRQELAQLEAVDASSQSFQMQSTSESNNSVSDMNWELDWDQFFMEPYLSMLGSDVQL